MSNHEHTRLRNNATPDKTTPLGASLSGPAPFAIPISLIQQKTVRLFTMPKGALFFHNLRRVLLAILQSYIN